MPALPPEAVAGALWRVVDGIVVDELVVDPASSLPANLADLMVTGAPDSTGRVYYDVAGGWSEDGVDEYRYEYVARVPQSFATAEELAAKSSSSGLAAPASPPATASAKLDPELQGLVATAEPSSSTEVYIELSGRFTTKLRGSSGLATVSLLHAEEEAVARQASIDARKEEAAQLRQDLVAFLDTVGAVDVAGFWTSNAVAAVVPVSALVAIAARDDVVSVTPPATGGPSSATDWDGADMKAADGLNGGIYTDLGYTGQAFAGSGLPGARHMRIAVMGGGFDADHPGFDDLPGGPSRAIAFDCRGAVCVPGQPPPQDHATKVAGLAAGSIREGQLPGFTAQERLERSGMAQEPEVYLLAIDASTIDAKLALEFSMELGIDVFASSTWLDSGFPCDGVTAQGLADTIYEAQTLQMIVVQSAGNFYDGTCSLVNMREAPSTFVVGASGNSTDECTSVNWSSCEISPYGERGGMTAWVGGTGHPEAISLVSGLAFGCPRYFFNTSGGISTSSACGTSFSTPQVAGAAVMVKDWFLDNGYSSIGIEGRLFPVVLAMTDRQYGWFTYLGHRYPLRKSTGFDPRWGGGRFQLRMLSGDDLAAPWGWETWSAVMTTGQTVSHPVINTAAEPMGIGQFKSYAMVFERSNDVADVDLSVRTANCAGAALATDSSYDVKSMVRLAGASAEGQALCTRLVADYVHPLENRRVHVLSYYSGDTEMR